MSMWRHFNADGGSQASPGGDREAVVSKEEALAQAPRSVLCESPAVVKEASPLLLLLPDLRLPRRILAAGRGGAGLDLVFFRLLGLAVAALLSLGHDVVSSWVSSSSAYEIGAAMVAGHDDETPPPEPLKIAAAHTRRERTSATSTRGNCVSCADVVDRTPAPCRWRGLKRRARVSRLQLKSRPALT